MYNAGWDIKSNARGLTYSKKEEGEKRSFAVNVEGWLADWDKDIQERQLRAINLDTNPNITVVLTIALVTRKLSVALVVSMVFMSKRKSSISPTSFS